MSPVEIKLDELDELDDVSNEDWAERIVEAAAFRHVARSPSCVGCCAWSCGRASCHECGWRCSARLDDPPQAGHGYFAMAALGTIGLAIEAATHNAKTTIAGEAATEGEAIQLALAKFREQFPTAEIAEIKLRWVPGEDDLS